ncbi:MAG: hypothetical protein BWY99_02454 [Synergistetes bacterium ADurb.BinA166]|nr:MAG: hypothetical protein BWY99_02454 [Synergistetes bacterium ADurb.BinA166]
MSSSEAAASSALLASASLRASFVAGSLKKRSNSSIGSSVTPSDRVSGMPASWKRKCHETWSTDICAL